MGGPFAGFLIGLFAVNWLHSLAHLGIGVAGLATYRNPVTASAYALAIGVIYAVLFILGMIFSLRFLGGVLPLNGWDHALHLITALIAFGAFFASRGRRPLTPALRVAFAAAGLLIPVNRGP